MNCENCRREARKLFECNDQMLCAVCSITVKCQARMAQTEYDDWCEEQDQIQRDQQDEEDFDDWVAEEIKLLNEDMSLGD